MVTDPANDRVREAVARSDADFQRSADTHLLPLSPHAFRGVDSIFTQMRLGPHPVRYAGHDTRVCGVDAEHSVFFDHDPTGDRALRLERGSIVTLLCDSGERCIDTYYRAAWRAEHDLECERETEQVQALLDRGESCAALVAQWRLGGQLS